MRNALWTWILASVAVVLIGSYVYMKFISDSHAPPPPDSAIGAPTLVPDRPEEPENPLLSADKTDVSRWFPGTCFAEMYMADPSFSGKLIPSCVAQVITQIEAEKGVTVTEADIRAAEVLAHFKQVYGAAGPWRQ
jgi:hypothetical protein